MEVEGLDGLVAEEMVLELAEDEDTVTLCSGSCSPAQAVYVC